MELTFRTIVVLLILLVSTLVFLGMILGWSETANLWFQNTIESLKGMFG